MQRRRLGGLEVSAVGLGCATMSPRATQSPKADPRRAVCAVTNRSSDRLSIQRSARHLLVIAPASLPFRRGWDQRFESAFLQRRVCKLSVPA
jgi:hypothetical protein